VAARGGGVTGVLVVGAGPTGLALAAHLHAQGARVRVVERRTGDQLSRAVIVQPRTLETLAPLAIAHALVARGDPSARARVHAGRRAATVRLAAGDLEDTPFPFLLSIPQRVVEEVLCDHLDRAGVTVERGVELTGLSPSSDGVAARVVGPAGDVRTLQVGWVVGCDGGDSTVRRLVGIPFPSRPYHPRLLLADVEVDGDLAPGTIQGFVGAPGILFLFPSPGATTWRLLTVHPSPGPDDTPPDVALLQSVADRFPDGRLRVRDLAWSTQVRLRRGQATTYRRDRVLLAGDAAHVHSPAGAQGMNTGLQDAANLGWKLAMVAAGAAPPALLDSYEAERWPVARWTRRVTDLAFLVEAGDVPPLGLLRELTAPLLLPLVDGRHVPEVAFRLLGGLLLRHRGSPAVDAGAPLRRGGVRSGDRLGDARVVRDGEPCWLHTLLRPPGHHLLLCGDPDRFPADATAALVGASRVALTVHHVTDRPRDGAVLDPGGRFLRRLGVSDTAVVLVRPDGIVAACRAGTRLDAIRHQVTQDPVGAPAPVG
jgi:2-polyprenyl-6-methoxyphenol hydroxylase-like FAD-dependent oxidoreductase